MALFSVVKKLKKKLLLTNTQKYDIGALMNKINFDTEDSTLLQDMELLQLSLKYFVDSNWKQTDNSSKLRHFISTTEPYYLSLTTYDNNIKLLNKELNDIKDGKQYFSNPVFMDIKSASSTPPLNTRIFYNRLYFYLTQNGQNLFKEQTLNDEQKKHRELLNTFLNKRLKQYDEQLTNLQTDNGISIHDYIFDIKLLEIIPPFSPLFFGIVGSLGKTKNWKNFKENARFISNHFYADYCNKSDELSELHHDNGSSLYSYWLDILFPDELFDLTLEFDRIIHQATDPFGSSLRYNLNLLAGEFPKIIFLTRIGQKNFYQHIKETVDEYLHSTLVNSTVDIFDEFTNARNTIDNNENDFFISYISHNKT